MSVKKISLFFIIFALGYQSSKECVVQKMQSLVGNQSLQLLSHLTNQANE